MEVGSSGDTPCAREVRAGKEGGSVFRNVVDYVIDNFLGKLHVACLAYPKNPLHLPVEAFARKP